MEDEFKEEQLLYERLLGAYHDFPPATSSLSRTSNSSHWEALNKVINALEKQGHTKYSEFKIIPDSVNRYGSIHYEVNETSLRMNMMSVLRMMGSEFGCGDPAYDLSQYSTGNNIHMSQNASPYANANSNQQQVQRQHQKVFISIEQELENLQRIVDENLSEEQIEHVSEPLETFKQNPIIWKNAQKLIQLGASFSKDVAVQFIGSVLAAAAMGGH